MLKSALTFLCLNVYCEPGFPKYVPSYLTVDFSEENKNKVVYSQARIITYNQFMVQVYGLSLSMQ